jgi:hypothetical protein
LLALLALLALLSLLSLLSLLAGLSWLSLLALFTLLTRFTRLSILLGGPGFGVHQFSGLLQALQCVTDFFADLSGDGVIGISLSLGRLLRQLGGAVELICGILSSLAGLLQLGLIQAFGGLLSVLSGLLGGLSGFAGGGCLILQSQRGIIQSLGDVFKHLRDVCCFVGDCLLGLLLRCDLSGTVLLYLSEGIRESIEVIALLTELVLAVLEWSLFQLICG